jgi:NAD(P)-dependent dehydrogenase (short-subunit alcohol dehydrogenase family)
MKRFEGKIVVVTGGSSGIGRATAMQFGEEGASVVIGDIDEKRGNEIVQEIKRSGASAIFIKTNVSIASDVENLMYQTVRTFGKLDCAVNNAGILGPLAGISEQTEKDFDSTVGVDLKGVWLSMKYEILAMRRQLQSAIVNVSSINGISSAAAAPIYSAAKHGIIGLTKCAALEYGASGIRINAICPGAVHTEMLQQSYGPNLTNLVMQIPIKRIAQLNEIAQAILWLCSDAASYLSGHALVCDGGVLAQ